MPQPARREYRERVKSAPPLPLAAEHWQAVLEEFDLSPRQARVLELARRGGSLTSRSPRRWASAYRRCGRTWSAFRLVPAPAAAWDSRCASWQFLTRSPAQAGRRQTIAAKVIYVGRFVPPFLKFFADQTIDPIVFISGFLSYAHDHHVACDAGDDHRRP